MKIASLVFALAASLLGVPCFAQDVQLAATEPPSIQRSLDAFLASSQATPQPNGSRLIAQSFQPTLEQGSSSSAPSQNPINLDNAGHEVEVFYGAGIGLDGFSLGNPFMNAGVRFGWMLTDRHSEGFFGNRFEFAVEIAPLFVAYQPGGAAFGFNFYGFILKWNFTPHGRIEPYFEMAGGAVVTNKDIPPGVYYFNFTPTATAGVRILRGKYAWSIGFRWLHISDAGITYLNPGDDTIGIRISFSRWLK